MVGVVFARDGRHGRLQHAVDAVFHVQAVVAGLDMNIAAAPLQGGKDRGVDQPNDGADIGLGRQLLDRDGFFGVFVLGDDIQGEAFAGLIQHALRLLGLLENVVDLRKGRNFRRDAPAEQQPDLVDHHQLAGIRHGNQQASVRLIFQRHKVVAEHQVHRHFAEQLVLDVEVLQIDELATVAARQRLRIGVLVKLGRKWKNCDVCCHI